MSTDLPPPSLDDVLSEGPSQASLLLESLVADVGRELQAEEIAKDIINGVLDEVITRVKELPVIEVNRVSPDAGPAIDDISDGVQEGDGNPMIDNFIDALEPFLE